MQGKIIRGIGGFYYVHAEDGVVYECRAKGIFRKEKIKPLPGDNVEISPVQDEEKPDVYKRQAHECGHAIQDQKQYGPLVLRSTLVPLANFGSSLSWPVFFAGLIFSIPPLLTAGIILFSLAVLFQLVTLPVEFNASSRALKVLEADGILGTEELAGGKKVLRAAALTYVAALASSILQLLRLIILAGGRRDRD